MHTHISVLGTGCFGSSEQEWLTFDAASMDVSGEQGRQQGKREMLFTVPTCLWSSKTELCRQVMVSQG